MDALNRDLIDRALHLLADILEERKTPFFQLIVCGGSSLIAMELVPRTTRDVDVLALLGPSGEIIKAKPLPAELAEAAKTVAADLLLDENWLNPEPGDLVVSGLPEGLEKRLHAKKYGERLTVHFIGRLDQIYFKVYAAASDAPGRHSDDLMALNPTPEEIEAAAGWSLAQDTSSEFKQILKDMLGKLGYEDIAERL